MLPDGPITLDPLPLRPESLAFDWPIPGSKSLTNRALVLAALAPGQSQLDGCLESDDTRHMGRCLKQLGIAVTEAGPHSLRVDGGRQRLRPASEHLFVGNSGTTVRFLSAVAALVPGETRLVGDEHMAKRPIADLTRALGKLGVAVECPTDCPPLTISGSGQLSGASSLPGDKSSQYVSALLMAGAGAGAGLELDIEGPLVSEPYVAMTIAAIEGFGGAVSRAGQRFTVHPGGLRPGRHLIEPDASAASYAFAAAAITGAEVWVQGLGNTSLQGDIAFADILEAMGCTVTRTADAIGVRGVGELQGVDVDMHHISDTVMTLAAIAPLAKGPTTIRNIANIRIKETDRLAATVAELRRLGQGVAHGEDWLRIEPAPICPATVECYADHRMAMSFALLGLVCPGITIADPACVSKTYPGFWKDLESFRATALESTG